MSLLAPEIIAELGPRPGILGHRWIFGALTLIVLTSLAWRFYGLARDPVAVSWSAGEFIDPGTYLYNARSFARTGHWRYSEGLGFQLAPGFALISGLWFRLTGPIYSHAALLSVLFGFISIICAALAAEIAARRWFEPLPQWWAAAFCVWSLSISYVFFGLQQIPNGDSVAVALSSVAAVLLMTLDLPEWRLQVRRLAYFAGLTLGLAPFIKLHAAMSSVAAVAAWCLGYWVEDETWKRTWKRATLPLILGLATSLIVWTPWLVEMRQQGGISPGWGEIVGVFAGSSTIWTVFSSNIVYRQTIELVLVLLALGRYIGSARRNWPLFFMTVWLVSGFLFISSMSYSPLRYRFVFVIPAVVFAAHLWASLMADETHTSKLRVSRIAQTVTFAMVSLACICTVLPRLGVHPGSGTVLLYSVAATIGILAIGGYLKHRKPWLSRPAIGVALIGGMLVSAVPQWMVGESHRDHELQHIAMKVTAADPQMVLSGDIGSEVALWTNLEVYVDPGAANVCQVTDLLLRERDARVLPAFVQSASQEVMRFVHPEISGPILLLQIDRNKIPACHVSN